MWTRSCQYCWPTVPSAGKILLTVFWDSQRVYMTEFLEAGNTVNSAQYIETIKNLWCRVCRVRRSTSPILLLHDNARPHTARAMIDALETLKFQVLSRPPYRPDLAPSDFHFFPHLKRNLKGLISPQMMKWSKLWHRGSNKELLSSSLTACINLFYVGKNVLNDKATMSKIKVCQFVAKILYFTSYFCLFKYMVSFSRYFTVCITYQPPLVPLWI